MKLTAADTAAAVDQFLAALVHPHKSVVEGIRREILACDPSISDGVKWNAPSFRTTEYFATTNLRAKNGVGIILHAGAKVRDTELDVKTIRDPQGLLKWLAKDRAMVTFRDAADFSANQKAFRQLISDWIRHV